ncbi:MAG: hypothetical protein JWN25_3427 [Verrucomicrobiales bacterium]|nr:hypothetical protein [Verrucomicrobiales bacterium]MDB6130309.1 hypothetical protein [Verrucomicrobiales bacterium]
MRITRDIEQFVLVDKRPVTSKFLKKLKAMVKKIKNHLTHHFEVVRNAFTKKRCFFM